MEYAELIDGVRTHPYITIVLASVVNGRVTAVVAGAAAAQGILNPFLAYGIFVAMDILGDTLYYCFGRVGHLMGNCFMRKIGWHDKFDKINPGFVASLPKAILIAKMTMIASKPVVITAGIAKLPFHKFYGVVTPCTLVLCVLYIVVGYLFCSCIV